MELKQLNEEQISWILSESHSFWSGGKDLKTRTQNYLKLQRESGLVCFYGLVSPRGEVLSSMKRYRLHMNDGHRVHPALGVGAVFTPEKFRGSGFATQLLQEMHSLSESQGEGISLLFSDIGTLLYESLGYQAHSVKLFNVPVVPGQQSEMSVQRVGETEREKLREVYLSCAFEGIRTERVGPEWDFYRSLNRTSDALSGDYWIRLGDREIGFVSLSRAKHTLIFEEAYGDFDCKGLANALQAFASENGCQEIWGWSSSTGGVFEAKIRQELAVPMIRGISLDKLQVSPIDHF